MVIILDILLFIILMIVLYRPQLDRRSYIVFGLVLLSSFLVIFIPTFVLDLLLCFILLLIISLCIPIPFSEVYAIVFFYFMFVIIGGTSHKNFEMWEYGDLRESGSTPAYLYSISIFVVCAVFFTQMKQNLFKHEKMLLFMNRSSIYILLVLFIFLVLNEIGYMDSLGVDANIFYQLTFLIIYLFFAGNYIVIYIYYRQLNRNEGYLKELEFKYKDLSKMSLDEKSKIIGELRQLVLDENFDKVLQYSELYNETLGSTEGQTNIDGIQDDYVSLIIQHKMNLFPDIHFVLEVKEFEVYGISSSYEYFLEAFTIVFDNAVEAALQSKEKIVRILFEGSSIKISNSYNLEDIEWFYSKKSRRGDENRMNGLKLLSALLDNTDLFMLSTVDEMVNVKVMVISND